MRHGGGGSWGRRVMRAARHGGGASWGRRVMGVARFGGGASWRRRVMGAARHGGGASWGRRVMGAARHEGMLKVSNMIWVIFSLLALGLRGASVRRTGGSSGATGYFRVRIPLLDWASSPT